MKNVLPLLILLLTFLGCGNRKSQSEFMYGLAGVWRLDGVHLYTGLDYNFEGDGRQSYFILEEDTVGYRFSIQTTSSGVFVTDIVKNKVQVTEEHIYMNGQEHLLKRPDDTTFVTQYRGVQSIWHLERNMSEDYIGEIRKIVISDTPNPNGMANSYILSHSERELKTTNYRLLFTVVGLLLLIGLISIYTYRTRQQKKHIQSMLEQIQEEQKHRPESVAQVMQDLESEFFASLYYISLQRRVTTGGFLKAEDWAELQQKFKPVFPNFINNLSNLCKMSDTELHVCILLKLKFSPSDIANAVGKEKSSVSSIRSRLYKKVFDKNGTSKDWDNFILSL